MLMKNELLIMKNVNKLTLTVLMLIGVFLNSCQNQSDFSSGTEKPIEEIDTSNLIDFKGLPVNNRFETPVEDLEIKHTQGFLKEKYMPLKVSETSNNQLPDYEVIVEATKSVIHEFPDGLIPNNPTQEIDTPAKQEKTKQHWEMIKVDFPTLSEAEIQKNMDLIATYYEQHLNDVVFHFFSKNKDFLAAKIEGKTSHYKTAQNSRNSRLAKLFNIHINNGKLNPFHIPKAALALALVVLKPQTYAQEYHGETDGGSITRGDAYRHTIGNALLADTYGTISAKNARIAFAKAVTDTYKTRTGGDADRKEMDYHNNAIGRRRWSDNTSNINFLAMTIGLNIPSTNEIKDLVRDAVNEKSCFIVKVKDENLFLKELLSLNQNIIQIKTKMYNTDSNINVFFEEIIAPSRYEYRYRYAFSHWEYYNCDGSFDDMYRTKRSKPIG